MMLTEGDTGQLTCFGQLRPIRDALEVVGGKWKILILTAVMQGNRRFTAIGRSIPGLSPKVLAKELKDLEEHQLLERRVHSHDHPTRVEYRVTAHAHSLKEVLLALHAWGEGHSRQLFGQPGGAVIP